MERLITDDSIIEKHVKTNVRVSRQIALKGVRVLVSLFAVTFAAPAQLPSFSLLVQPAQPLFDDPVTITVSAADATSSGSVEFLDGTVPIGYATLVSGNASIVTRRLFPGSHEISAVVSVFPSTLRSVYVSPVSVPVKAVPSGGLEAPVIAQGGAGSTDLLAIDLNNDLLPDLVSADLASGAIVISLSRGDGTFTTATTFSSALNPTSLMSGDFNRDQNPDVIAVDCNGGIVTIMLGNGDGSLAAPQTVDAGANPCEVTVSDFNRDGKPDVAVCSYESGTVSILLGNGDGTFSPPVAYGAGSSPSALTVADTNGDGIPDLIIADESDASVAILQGIGDGTFAAAINYPVANFPIAVTAADLNGDGITDLVVAGENSIGVLIGQQTGRFSNVVSYDSGGSAISCIWVGDVDGDGYLDLMIGDSSTSSFVILKGAGDGTFWSPAVLISGVNPVAVSAADFDQNGVLDFAYADSFAGVFVASSAADNSATNSSGASPSISSATPGTVDVTQNTNLTVMGSGFSPGDVLYWDYLPLETAVNSSSELSAIVPMGIAPGDAGLWIYNSDGSASRIIAVTAKAPSSAPAQSNPQPAPVLNNVTTNGTQPSGVAITLTVNGSGFEIGAVARWNGIPLPTTYLAPTQLTAFVAPNLVIAPGTILVTVNNPDGGISGPVPFVEDTPGSNGSQSSNGGGSTQGGGGAGSTAGTGTAGGEPAAGTSGSESPCSLRLSASSLSFSWSIGEPAPATQTIDVFCGLSTDQFSVSVGGALPPNWLSVSALSGETPGLIGISINISNAPTTEQAYFGQVVVAGASSTVTIPVTLIVLSPGVETRKRHLWPSPVNRRGAGR